MSVASVRGEREKSVHLLYHLGRVPLCTRLTSGGVSVLRFTGGVECESEWQNGES